MQKKGIESNVASLVFTVHLYMHLRGYLTQTVLIWKTAIDFTRLPWSPG